MKYFFLSVCVCFHLNSVAQNIRNYEKPPVFKGCESQTIDDLKACFNTKLNQHIYENFKVPQEVTDDSFKGDVKVLFEVDKEEIRGMKVEANYFEGEKIR